MMINLSLDLSAPPVNQQQRLREVITDLNLGGYNATARAAGVYASQIFRCHRGKPPGVVLLRRIAKGLNLHPAVFWISREEAIPLMRHRLTVIHAKEMLQLETSQAEKV